MKGKGLFSRRKKANKKKRIDIPKWTGWNQIKAVHGPIKETAKRLFVPEQPEREESFEEATQRLGVDETELFRRQGQYKRTAYCFTILAALTIVYGVYLLIHSHYSATFLSISAAGLFIGQAFRFHFWHFQIKQRKLGCTLQDWWHSDVKGS